MPPAIGYSVEARPRTDLRRLASEIRDAFWLDGEPYFPIVELLDVLEEHRFWYWPVRLHG